MANYVRLASFGPGEVFSPSLAGGGLIAVFDRGVNVLNRQTLAPVNVYPNPDGSGTPITQPITTNSQGTLPGYVLSGIALSLQDTSTNEIVEIEPIAVNDLVGTDGHVGGAGSRGLPASVVSASSASGDKYSRTNVLGNGAGTRTGNPDIPSILDFGAKCDGVRTFGNVSNGSTTFTSVATAGTVAAVFQTSDVGKLVCVQNAGPTVSGVASDLLTTIASVPSPGTSSCTLAAAASRNLTAATAFYATDDLAVIANAIADMVSTAAPPVNPVGGILRLPPAMIGISAVLDLGVIANVQFSQYRSLRIQGAGSSGDSPSGIGTTTLLNFGAGTAIKSYNPSVFGLHLRDFDVLCVTDIGQGNFAVDWSNVNCNSSVKRVRAFGRGNGNGGVGNRPNVGNGVRIDCPAIGQNIFEDVNADRFDAPYTLLSPPTSPSASAVGSGGTFAAGAYFWKITALLQNPLGTILETSGSAEVTATLVLNGSCNLSWTAPGSIPAGYSLNGYRIYRATATGGETTSPAFVTTIGSGTPAYTDTGTAVSTGSVPPTNTAFTYPGSEGFRIGSASTGPGLTTGVQSGNLKLAGLRSSCTVGFRFNNGALFNSLTLDALKAVMTAGSTVLSNGGSSLNLPASTIPVASVANFSTSGGTIVLYSASGSQVVSYTGISSNTFTGCTGGTGTIPDGSSVYEATQGSVAYWFEGSNHQGHVLNAPHSEQYQIAYWMNGSQGVQLNSPWAEIPGSSSPGDGSVGLLFDNGAYGNVAENAELGGRFGGFDVGVRFMPSTKANMAKTLLSGTGVVWTAMFQRSALNEGVDLSQIGWQKPTLQSGFNDPGGTSGSPEIGLSRNGLVRGRGLVNSGAAKSAGALMFTLPAALIPTVDQFFVTLVQGSSDPSSSDVGFIKVLGQGQGASAGQVQLWKSTTTSGNVALNAIQFTLDPQT